MSPTYTIIHTERNNTTYEVFAHWIPSTQMWEARNGFGAILVEEVSMSDLLEVVSTLPVDALEAED